MATFKAVVFQTGRHIKLDGTSNIKIRIYHNRESQYISTAYYIRPENMDESGRILSGVTNGEMIEYEINAYIQKIRREYLKLGQDRTQFMSCMDLKEEIEKSLAPDAEFIDFVEFAQNIVIQTKKKKTAEWYSSSIHCLIKPVFRVCKQFAGASNIYSQVIATLYGFFSIFAHCDIEKRINIL